MKPSVDVSNAMKRNFVTVMGVIDYVDWLKTALCRLLFIGTINFVIMIAKDSGSILLLFILSSANSFLRYFKKMIRCKIVIMHAVISV